MRGQPDVTAGPLRPHGSVDLRIEVAVEVGALQRVGDQGAAAVGADPAVAIGVGQRKDGFRGIGHLAQIRVMQSLLARVVHGCVRSDLRTFGLVAWAVHVELPVESAAAWHADVPSICAPPRRGVGRRLVAVPQAWGRTQLRAGSSGCGMGRRGTRIARYSTSR